MKKLFIIFAILCLAAPAMAADWNFYGSARMATFWVDNDKNDADDQDLQWAQQGNSRIGATVMFNDQIGGGFEMSDSFGKRKLYGTYNFANGAQLLLGQTYAPSAWFLSNSVYDGDGDLLGVGEFYEGRVEMVQFKMGGLKVALINPNTQSWVAEEVTVDGETFAVAVSTDQAEDILGVVGGTAPDLEDFANVDTDVTLPKIEVGYDFKADAFFLSAFAGYQTYELEDAVGENYDINSYVLGIGGGVNIGAAYLKAGFHYGQNLENYGAYDPTGALLDGVVVADGEEYDSDAMGFLAVAGFNVSEMLTIEAGYGYQQYEHDLIDDVENEATQYYVNATINIAPGFFIVPEVGMIDYEDDIDEGDLTYFGAKWQINF